MRHLTGSAYARFDKPVHMYRGETMAGIIADEARHDPSRGFVGGYYMETLSLGPAFLASFVEPGMWGRKFTELMDAYENTAGMWIVGEDMPQETNRVTLSDSCQGRAGAAGAARQLRRPRQRPGDAGARLRQCRPDLSSRSARPGCTTPRRTPRRTTSAPAG